MYDPRRDWSLSFSGCGFLGFYHIGVTNCLSERAPHLLRDARMFFGSSAGALHCVTFLSGMPLGMSRAGTGRGALGGADIGRGHRGVHPRGPCPDRGFLPSVLSPCACGWLTRQPGRGTRLGLAAVGVGTPSASPPQPRPGARACGKPFAPGLRVGSSGATRRREQDRGWGVEGGAGPYGPHQLTKLWAICPGSGAGRAYPQEQGVGL